MRLAAVVETSRRVAETTKRLEKVDLLARQLKQLHPEEVEIVVAFLTGRTRQGRIGIGYGTIRNAKGSPATEPSLEVAEIDRSFESITKIQGSGSQRLRLELLSAMFARATEPEQQFLIGLLMGELRQGALEGIMLDAIAKASGVRADRVRRAAMMTGDISVVARALVEKGEAGLHSYDVQLFRPIQPMLAQTAEDVTEALADLGEAALEFKMDGARVQVHKSGDEVMVYSRALNDVSAAVPEVVEAVRALPAQNLILDGEVLSLLPDGRPQPFQITMRRFGRKLDVQRMRGDLPMTPFWFDLLYLNGGSLLDEPQARRFQALVELAPQSLISHIIATNAAAGDEFFERSLAQGHEGIMAKAVGATYAAGARGQSWLKIKRPRTLDLVILAAEWGHGRRQGWLSNLHLGARDTEKGGFAMLGKTFKGLTDEMLVWQTQELLKLEIGRDSYTVHVEPKLVVEIAFNEIQVSPRYPSGLALRFARVKSYRPDKTAADADTFQTVQKMAGNA
ncbi:MAG TPA: ATP-dependent DNA ligase [Bryobacteraceae bacterium]|nr:ATP-dependent DNA ligase [Bryobacteraceae bacterium]